MNSEPILLTDRPEQPKLTFETPHKRSPDIALVTMTKNGMSQRSGLVKLFESVLGLVNKAIILDTGSTDNTVEWLKAQKFFPVALYQEPFVDFEHSRNRLMEHAARQADWLLLLDDDMFLKFEKPPTEILASLNPNMGCYLLKHHQDLEYWVGRLVRGNRLWKYKGVTHEYLEGSGKGNPQLEGLEIHHWFDHGPAKFERDLRLLSADIARDPNDTRTIFYLASTLRDMGQIDAAIRFFVMRVAMGGWDEEKFYAAYEAARLAKDPKGMVKAFGLRPTRAEPAAWLAAYFRFVEPDEDQFAYWESVRSKISLPKDDVLFVKTAAYGPGFIERMRKHIPS